MKHSCMLDKYTVRSKLMSFTFQSLFSHLSTMFISYKLNLNYKIFLSFRNYPITYYVLNIITYAMYSISYHQHVSDKSTCLKLNVCPCKWPADFNTRVRLSPTVGSAFLVHDHKFDLACEFV
jgi:hypothetical protein